MSRRIAYYSPSQVGIDAKAATGFGNALLCTDANAVTFSVGTASSANLTLKVQGAVGETAPDFTAAASATNRWFYVDIAILNNAGVVTDGDTGVVFSGTDANVGVNVNVDNLDFVCLHVSARSAGSVTAEASFYSI